jgi:hypothetical protein
MQVFPQLWTRQCRAFLTLPVTEKRFELWKVERLMSIENGY